MYLYVLIASVMSYFVVRPWLCLWSNKINEKKINNDLVMVASHKLKEAVYDIYYRIELYP